MILFCDTPALIKLYIVEEGSDVLKTQLSSAEAVAVCRIAWAEAHAALSRRAREVPQDALVVEQAKAALAADWPHFVVLEIDQALVERAGEYADTFALRGYDSIQLAAAYETGRISQLPIFFACFDIRLNKAARLLGMSCF
ncbi:twitching motility protein PilT [Sulfuriferula plumbiphila]|uniref:Twitching motility protein PilT n=1 Tax=Sulfuriferula plumbiphila TaxID=171865 RepID=A0A512LCF6_9PROT|nr:type II toxin-antitoxin system VapC family toxin [Sulfuriferula plumbiphila]BBP05740.1 twitching motility protein PilT [Sulfuriferula plumbiphila]GEP32178.1 twitching motility protein PilT [Sulfuriferula plumbiphila]